MAQATFPGAAGCASRPDRNLALELARVTEAAALGAARWIGRGDKDAADQAAVDAMRAVLDTVSMAGVVVIGEGEKDEAPMLYNGEEVGDGQGPGGGRRGRPARGDPADRDGPAERDRGDRGRRARHDVLPGRGRLHGQDRLRPRGVDVITSRRPRGERRARRAGEGREAERDLVVVLERDRHAELIASSAGGGVRCCCSLDGDVAPALLPPRGGTGVDLLMGIGGTPEGVISAAAIKCLGGCDAGEVRPRNDDERRALLDGGYDLDRVLTHDDLVGGEDVFVAATGVTDGGVAPRRALHGREGAVTNSIVMRSRSGTVRRVEASMRSRSSSASRAASTAEAAPGAHRRRDGLRRPRRGVGEASRARPPALKHGLGIGDGRVGLALFVMAVATVIGMRAAPLAVRRVGQPRRRPRGNCRFLPRPPARFGPAVASSYAWFCASWWRSGARWPARRRLQRPGDRRPAGVRPADPGRAARRLSVALFAGGAVGALAAAIGVSPTWQFAVVAAVLALASAPLLAWQLPQADEPAAPADRSHLPLTRVLALGAIGFAAFVGEGAAADWSAIYARDNLGAGSGAAAVAVAAFGVAMAVARFTGDGGRRARRPARRRGRRRRGDRLRARRRGARIWPRSTAGFALVGLGLGAVYPVAFSASGTPGALGRVVTLSYVGSIAGPAAIGLAATRPACVQRSSSRSSSAPGSRWARGPCARRRPLLAPSPARTYPVRAAPFIFARWWNACWPATTLSFAVPGSAGACSARPYEKHSFHGLGLARVDRIQMAVAALSTGRRRGRRFRARRAARACRSSSSVAWRLPPHRPGAARNPRSPCSASAGCFEVDLLVGQLVEDRLQDVAGRLRRFAPACANRPSAPRVRRSERCLAPGRARRNGKRVEFAQTQYRSGRPPIE